MSSIISLSAEFVADYHIDITCADLCTDIEDLMRAKKFDKASKKLFQLFSKLAQSEEDEEKIDDAESVHENSYVDMASHTFWNHKAKQLLAGNPSIAFELAWDCMNAIEDNLWTSEELQTCAYALANNSAREVLSIDPDYKIRSCALLKCVMRRSAEFEDQDLADMVFENAGEQFLRVLELYAPSQRYDEVFELSLWLGSRKKESPLLQNFVDEILVISEEYENGIKYIPDWIEKGGLSKSLERPSYLTLVYSRSPE